MCAMLHARGNEVVGSTVNIDVQIGWSRGRVAPVLRADTPGNDERYQNTCLSRQRAASAPVLINGNFKAHILDELT